MAFFTLALVFTLFVFNKLLVGKVFSPSLFPWFPYLLILFFYDTFNQGLISIDMTVYAIFYTYAIVYFFSEYTFSYLLNKPTVTVNSYNLVNDSYLKWAKILAIFLIIMLFYFYLKSLVLLNIVGPEKYRSIATGYSGEISPVFGSAIMQLFYFYIVQGLIILLSVVSALSFFSKKDKSLLCIMLVVVLLDSGITFGRFMFYYFVMIYLFVAFLLGVINIKKIFSITIIMIFIVIFMYTLSQQRFSSGDFGFYDFIQRYILGYHFYPISLLSSYFETSPSIGGEWNGSAFFSSYFFYISKVINFIFDGYHPFLTSEEFLSRGLYKFVGYDSSGESIYVNAFYPMFVDMYNDLGFLGIILITSILAFFMVLFKPSYEFNGSNLYAYIILNNLIVFGLFKNQFVFGYVPIFTLLLILSFLINKKSLNERK